jgi:hypothetical protein
VAESLPSGVGLLGSLDAIFVGNQVDQASLDAGAADNNRVASAPQAMRHRLLGTANPFLKSEWSNQ